MSRFTGYLSLFVIVAASFMRQVLDGVRLLLEGLPLSLGVFVWLSYLFFILPIFFLLLKKVGVKQLLFFLFVVALGFLYAQSFESVEERVHLVFFGAIGFFFAQDNSTKGWSALLLSTTLFSLMISSLDEIFQLYLPYRVGDIRDIVFGALGGLWGGLLSLCFHSSKKEKTERAN